MRTLHLILGLILWLGTCEAKKKSQPLWFKASSQSDCELASSEFGGGKDFRTDHPKVLCGTVNQTICVCVKKNPNSLIKFACGECSFNLKFSKDNKENFKGSKETPKIADSPEIIEGPWEKNRWPDRIVPYEMEASNQGLKIFAVKVAMAKISKVSCIKFVPYDPELHSKYLIVKSGSPGCWTKTVGYPKRQKNILNIGSGCGTANKILHEVLHAVGMYHTHQRHDRDDYITVVKDNIAKDKRSSFNSINKNKFPDFGVPYDCNSLMHYPKKFFGKERNLETIQTKDEGGCDSVGPRGQGMTDSDVLWLNRFYDCPVA